MIDRLLCALGFHDVSPAKRERYLIVTRCTRKGCLHTHTYIFPWKIVAAEILLDHSEEIINLLRELRFGTRTHSLRHEDWR